MKGPTAAFLLHDVCFPGLRTCRGSYGEKLLSKNVKLSRTLTSLHFSTVFDWRNPRQHSLLPKEEFRQEACSSFPFSQIKRTFALSSVKFLSEIGREASKSTATSTATSTGLSPKQPLSGPDDTQKPMSNWEKFKDMYKKYWYVLIPVHGVLSVGFMVILYYIVKSGVDVVPLLEKLGVPERIIGPIRKSGASAYIAAAYAIYHLISPLRYAVTLGLTTLTITYLKRFGYIKPVPSSKRIKEMYREGRERVQVFSRRFTGNRSKRPEK